MEHDSWQSILDAQDGVVTTEQLRAHGVSATALRHRVVSGQWLRVLPRVIAVTNGPLTRPMALSAALLYGGRAILSHRTAAEEWGLLRVDDPSAPVHITVPYNCSAVNQGQTVRSPGSPRPTSVGNALVHGGVVVHRSRAFEHISVPFRRPRTSLADTVIDLAVSEATPREAALRFIEAATSGKVHVEVLRRKLEVRRPHRYATDIADAVMLLGDGVQSALEHRYALDVERAHGLPSGKRQMPHVVDGRILYEDVDYSPMGVPLIVRLDGQQYHSAQQSRFRDRRRDNAAELADRPRLVYGWDETTRDPCGVFEEVRRVLVREGWADMSRRCPACPRE
ncbi:type IV toxin-antitoxin system AbiEi family antitoxin domain-containing protein [Rhodococcus opacus]|uniref:type IV toxin-antitoxin system AbiEi family antitoxin domain-containing protein n=1 Tax=Rhodococcus opacus TaxID=37919 RepID=UPI001FF3E020|nr:type IV toxin-antitoxin system AbiEi family antitoxin domain-containing protein [Rhodococcus opacus]UOT04738.1 type IV toxin-antitoxin system AbiEi family antitoxin domain-containing protein [Rhodococcus opacus]